MPKMRRSRADREQFWTDTITAWKESGQSIRAFCAARGIAQATFFVKRRELARRGPHAEPAAPTRSPSFAAVRVIAEPVVEVVLPTGLLVRVPSSADPVAVARLVTALRGVPC
jgi:transposase